MEGIWVPILISLGAFAMIVFLRKYENEEKLSMIEKGLNPDEFKQKKHTHGGFRFALMAIGAGVGLLVGSLLDEYTHMGDDVAYFSMIFIFGGLGLLLSYFVGKKDGDQ